MMQPRATKTAPTDCLRAILAIAAVAATILTISGCRSISSIGPLDASNAAAGPQRGIYYFLPESRIVIDVSRASESSDDDSEGSEDDPDAEPAPAAPVSAGDFLVASSAAILPDPDARYLLRHERRRSFSDTVIVAVDENGLLTSVDVTTEDTTPAVIGDLVDIATNIARLSVGAPLPTGSAALTAAEMQTLLKTQPKPFRVHFDPLDPADVARAQKVASRANWKIDVSSISNASTSSSGGVGNGNVSGVAFRPGVPVEVEVTANTDPGLPVRERFVVPDKRTTVAFDLDRLALVEKNTALEFASGMLVKATLTEPSQVQAAVGIPKNALKAIVPLPGEARRADKANLALELERLQAQQALDAARNPSNATVLQGEIDELTKQKELLELRKEIEALRRGGSE